MNHDLATMPVGISSHGFIAGTSQVGKVAGQSALVVQRGPASRPTAHRGSSGFCAQNFSLRGLVKDVYLNSLAE